MIRLFYSAVNNSDLYAASVIAHSPCALDIHGIEMPLIAEIRIVREVAHIRKSGIFVRIRNTFRIIRALLVIIRNIYRFVRHDHLYQFRRYRRICRHKRIRDIYTSLMQQYIRIVLGKRYQRLVFQYDYIVPFLRARGNAESAKSRKDTGNHRKNMLFHQFTSKNAERFGYFSYLYEPRNL